MSITCPSCRTSFALAPEEIGTNGRKVRCSNCQHIWYQKPDVFTTAAPTANHIQQSITPSNRPLAELAASKEFVGDLELRSTTYGGGREKPSTGSLPKSPAEVELDKKYNNTLAPPDINKVPPNGADNLVYATKEHHLPVLLPLTSPQPANNVSIILINLIFLLLYILFHEKLNIFVLPHLHDNKLIIENIQTNQTTINNQLKLSYRITNNNTHNIMIPLIRVRLLDKQYIPVKTYILDQKNIKLLSNQYIEINTTLTSVPSSSTSLDIMIGNSLDFILQ